MPSAIEVNLGYRVISPIYHSKAKKGNFVLLYKIEFSGKFEFLDIT